MLCPKSFKMNNTDMESAPVSPPRNGVSGADNKHIGCRRDSTTELIILPDLSDDDSIQDWENSSESTTGLDNSFSDLAIQIKSTLDCAIDKVKTDRWQPRGFLAVEPPKYRLMDQTENTKAMAIVSDREEFRKLKLKLKESGMLTNYSVRAILNPELENSASEIASKSA